ncbi:hypothetical protein [Tuberibacillus calidus]|uniref:hypothetical protein n=1 Tax=Tuberibacillus calidus TaxID=340097 RepID=UPI00040029B2|nr:hypothetical protein [Tuberibacillus calidus]
MIKANKSSHQKNRWQFFLFILTVSFLTALLMFLYHRDDQTEQSLTYFPDDPLLAFKSHETHLTFLPDSPYTLQWQVRSVLNTKSYLRQDVSFLFKDQQLIGILSNWRENTDVLEQQKTMAQHTSGYYEAISVHHAESHYPNGEIRGKETMSFDRLAVMKTSSGWEDFKIPETDQQERWIKEKFHTFSLKQQALLSQAAHKYHIDLNQYIAFPLSHIHIYDHEPLPGLSQEATHKTISRLWEGLYKDYALGVHITSDDIRTPIGSTVPILLFDKNESHLLVIIQLSSGEIVLLKQKIEP